MFWKKCSSSKSEKHYASDLSPWNLKEATPLTIWTLSFKRRTFLLGFNQPNRYASPELGLQVISETEGSQESVSFTWGKWDDACWIMQLFQEKHIAMCALQPWISDWIEGLLLTFCPCVRLSMMIHILIEPIGKFIKPIQSRSVGLPQSSSQGPIPNQI
jgi:hypothetical protein